MDSGRRSGQWLSGTSRRGFPAPSLRATCTHLWVQLTHPHQQVGTAGPGTEKETSPEPATPWPLAPPHPLPVKSLGHRAWPLWAQGRQRPGALDRLGPHTGLSSLRSPGSGGAEARPFPQVVPGPPRAGATHQSCSFTRRPSSRMVVVS